MTDNARSTRRLRSSIPICLGRTVGCDGCDGIIRAINHPASGAPVIDMAHVDGDSPTLLLHRGTREVDESNGSLIIRHRLDDEDEENDR